MINDHWDGCYVSRNLGQMGMFGLIILSNQRFQILCLLNLIANNYFLQTSSKVI